MSSPLIDDRQDGAGDEVPVFVEIEGDDRLDVGCPPGAISRADAEVMVALDRHADEVGDRVGELLGEILVPGMQERG